MNGIGYQFQMCNTITAQLIRHDLSRFTTMASQWVLEEALSCGAVSTVNWDWFNLGLTPPNDVRST
jgi:hypothetical protein